MASGPEHYKEAESALESALQPGLEPEWVAARLARAQVHATLALAAATALPAVQRYYGDESTADRRWCEVTS